MTEPLGPSSQRYIARPFVVIPDGEGFAIFEGWPVARKFVRTCTADELPDFFRASMTEAQEAHAAKAARNPEPVKEAPDEGVPNSLF